MVDILDCEFILNLDFYNLDNIKYTIDAFKENDFNISFKILNSDDKNLIIIKIEENSSIEEIEEIKDEFVNYLNYVEFEKLKNNN